MIDTECAGSCLLLFNSSACTNAPSNEIYGESMQGIQCWKVHSVDYNSVADNTVLSSFII